VFFTTFKLPCPTPLNIHLTIKINILAIITSYVFQIPLSVIFELNQVTNVSELFSKFMPDTNIDEAQTLFATTGFQSKSMN